MFSILRDLKVTETYLDGTISMWTRFMIVLLEVNLYLQM